MVLNFSKFFLAAIAISGIGLASCKAAEGELVASDLIAPANLAMADRTVFTDKCVARRAQLFANLIESGGSLKPSDVQELKKDMDETFPRFCGCLDRELEKGLSKLQFMMAQTMIDQDTFISYPGSPMPEFDILKGAATRLGMSETDFESARQKFRLQASHAGEACFLTLWAPSLARKLGVPEMGTYSGPPAGSQDDLDAARLIAEEQQAVRAYSLCLEGSARNLARNSNDPSEIIEPAAFASCEKNRQIVFDAYNKHGSAFSMETMSALEQTFRRKLPQIVVRTRELRDAQPGPAQTKP